MPLTPADVEAAYRLILERTPSQEVLADVSSKHDNLGTLRRVLLSSEEFYRKFDPIRPGFIDRLKPILVHLLIPEAMGADLFEALTGEEKLKPVTHVDAEDFAALCAKPRPERLKLRYVYGDLGAGAGEALRLPCMYLCAIARPGPRIYRLYRMACGAEGEAEMSFGAYLQYSLESVPHRMELDNGQMRRLAGQQDVEGLGQERDLLARALHNALAPEMILGLFERPATLASRLVEEGFLSAPTSTLTDEHDESDPDYAAARDGLSDNEQVILDAYTAWDSYLYEVCEGLLFPPTE